MKPRTQRERLALHGTGELSLSVSAPPERGRANEACIDFLARVLKLPKRSITIIAGEKSRRKLVSVESENPNEVAERLLALARAVGR